MHDNQESRFTLTLLKDDVPLQVLQFSGQEALNHPYRFEIEIIALAPAINLRLLMHQEAFLDLGNGRGIHGTIHCATGEDHGGHRIGYTVTLVPLLQTLEQRRAHRVFHHVSVPDILQRLLTEHDLPSNSYRLELTGQYPTRPFTLQYEETDLALLLRLCEEQGIHFHFEHSREGHVLVLADDCMSLPQEPMLLSFRTDAHPDRKRPGITRLYQRHTGGLSHARPDARYTSTAAPVDAAVNEALARPGQTYEAQQSLRQLERLRCPSRQIHGHSNQSALHSARIIQVAEHPVPGFNDQWLLTNIRHRGRQVSILAQDSAVSEYHNEFTAIPWSTVFRPPLHQPRPSITSPQPARVIGPPGQPAVLDDQGRLQVCLWPHAPADDACGIRVPVACTTLNQHPDTLPAAGSVVFISFLDGDPDRPVFCTSRIDALPSAPAASPGKDTGLLLDWLLEI